MIIKITANYPHDEIKEILYFAAKSIGVNHARLIVKVKNSRKTYRGTAFNWAWSKDNGKHGATRMITLGIGKPELFPHTPRRYRQKFVLNDWQEALVRVAAHEFQHVRDYDNGIKASETAANGECFVTLQEWRKQRTIKK